MRVTFFGICVTYVEEDARIVFRESQQVSRRLIFELMLRRAFGAPEITIRYFHYSLIRNRHFCITKPPGRWERSPFSANSGLSNWMVNSIAMMLFRQVIIPKRLLSLKRDSHYRFSLFTSALFYEHVQS